MNASTEKWRHYALTPARYPAPAKPEPPGWMLPWLRELREYVIAGAGRELDLPLCLGIRPDGRLCRRNARRGHSYCRRCRAPKEEAVSLTDPLVIVCEPKRDLPYTLQRGRETFFDAQDYQRRWKTLEEAREWAILNLSEDPYEHLGDQVRAKHPAQLSKGYDDLPLFGGDHD